MTDATARTAIVTGGARGIGAGYVCGQLIYAAGGPRS